ncbi:MAG: efflux RND transporter periplasmic adaptor subunit [Bacteroidetes bacterium]|nr:efflux RND transporter periplasmic adaptor subunit [Bacteroidota bacterium]MCL1969542.1 efflux RND transporter periplasmic adaptor subunit [Bacteroidota bacterium]
MYKYILTLLCPLLIMACNNNKTTNEDATLFIAGDTITLADNSPVLEQIVIQKTDLQEFSAEFRTVGTVRPVAGKLAEIAPPFAGRIVKSHVKLGQKVSAGSTIFELSSTEYYEAVKNYFSAQSANDVAQRNFNRQKELATHGVASQKDLEQAQSEANIAQQEFEQAQSSLQIFNVDLSAIRTTAGAMQALSVQSPIAGEVVKYNITIGGYVKEDAEPLAVVADLSKVWVAALVKEKYFGAIKQGDRIEVYTDAHPNKIIWGTICYIGEMLDEETRSLEVIVECDNSNRELKLGMFCETHFLSAPTKAIVLPATALMQEQEYDYVFVEIAKGKFVRRKVVIESVHKGEVRIISGIGEGENVVVNGGIYLQ